MGQKQNVDNHGPIVKKKKTNENGDFFSWKVSVFCPILFRMCTVCPYVLLLYSVFFFLRCIIGGSDQSRFEWERLKTGGRRSHRGEGKGSRGHGGGEKINCSTHVFSSYGGLGKKEGQGEKGPFIM